MTIAHKYVLTTLVVTISTAIESYKITPSSHNVFSVKSLISPEFDRVTGPTIHRIISGNCDFIRGGSSDDDESDAISSFNENHSRDLERYTKLLKYRTEQQLLYQLRSTYLSEILSTRGVPVPTVTGVATPEGNKPPAKVDWDCCMSTDQEPKSCLYSFDAETNTKVVAPIGTDQWISLTALNRLRRMDPTKVEPMWHSRYSILQSWFSDSSEYSMLQYIGFKGFLISSILLDGGNGMVLRSFLIGLVLSLLIVLMPLLEYIVGRILVSAPFWAQWQTWGRIVRAGFPLKLLLGQLVWKGVASSFSKLENRVRDYFVDLECEILEESVPLTLSSGSKQAEDGIEEFISEATFDDYESDGEL